jgi:integrase
MAALDRKTLHSLPGPGPGARELTHWDERVRGLGLRVLTSGRRSWVVRWRIGKRQAFQTLGDVAELSLDKARRRAGELIAAGKIGQDAKAEIVRAKAEAAQTLARVIALHLERHGPSLRPSTLADRKRYLVLYWQPLHGLAVADIKRASIAEMVARIAKAHGGIAANRALEALNAALVWAMRQGLAEHNPAIGVPDAAREVTRERVLSGDELRDVWCACGDDDYARIVRLLLLTGQRREEVAGMRWSELALDRALWSLPGERTKNNRPHDVPLSDQSLAILASVQRRGGRDLVFGAGAGPFSGWSRAKVRLDARLTAKPAGDGGPETSRPPWCLHDLRRTVVTGMAEIGVQPHVIEAVVNHVSGHKAGVAGVCNRATYAAEKRQALDRWAAHVMALVAGEPAKVVSLHRHAAAL